MLQNTVSKPFEFEGKGLHSGKSSHMRVNPAPAGTGIVFRRIDLGEDACVEALAENVSSTARSTTISSGPVVVSTIEHIMSAFYGLGIDNAIVDIDNVEVPILDGSSRFYVEALKGNVQQLSSERKLIRLPQLVEVKDEKTGSWVRLSPSDSPSFEATSDFGSKVLGVQTAGWDPSIDYSSQIAPCRTFVFFHEIEFLFRNNLIKGGDVDNAIVIVEYPVTDKQLDDLSKAIDKPKLAVTPGGYLNNLSLYFPNECGRHKLLDLMGDLRLVGGYLSARVEAFKPGHTINNAAAKAVVELLKTSKND